jgi:hypothetical protein
MTHETRIAALERRINAGAFVFPDFARDGRIAGPDQLGLRGALRWKREPGEDLEQFAERCAAAAVAAGETSLIIGGLPRGDEMDEFGSFEEWWATIAPNYSDVPAPARRRLLASGD